MNPMFTDGQKKYLAYSLIAVFILLALFLAVQALSAIKGYLYVGRGTYPSNTITVSGRGEVMAVPDTGSFSFSVIETAKTTAVASDASSTKMNAIIAALKDLGVAEKDIQTSGYNVYPKYEYSRIACTMEYCPPSKETLTGYEVSQTVTVKIRATADSGKILAKVTELGASNVSGLSFIVDDADAVKAEARDKAIADARAKAERLAKSLGVSLGDVMSFSDSYGGYPVPMYVMGGVMMEKAVSSAGYVAPDIQVGENSVVSNVNITYEIH